MKTVERHKKTDFGDVWYVNAADGTYRFAVYKYDDDNDTIYLSNVFVKEDSRGQGYGNEILTSAEDYANRLGASVICLKVLSGSDVHRWYKRHGYEDLEKDEEERGYMWMRKVLNVSESIWSDMQDRGTGDSVKTEDIDDMSFPELYQYMQKIYVCTRKYDIYYDNDSDTITATLFSDKVNSYNIFFMKSMADSRKTVYVEKNFVDTLGCFDEMKDKYYLRTYDVLDGVCIDVYPDEHTEPTNRFFLEVFDYLLDKIHAPLKKHIEKKSNVNESIWSDMQDRGTGDSIKKEDITEDDKKEIDYIFNGFAYLIVHTDGYEPTIDDFIKMIKKAYPDKNYNKYIAWVRLNWDKKYKDELDEKIQYNKKDVDERINKYLNNFVGQVVYCEKYNVSLPDIKKFSDEVLKYCGLPIEMRFVGKIRVDESWLDIFKKYVDENWNDVKKRIDDFIVEENQKIAKTGFKKTPGKKICDILDEWWDSLGDEKDDIAWDEFGERAEEKYYETHNPKYSDYTGEDFNSDEEWSKASWIESIEIYMKYNQKTNESIWSDMQERGTGDSVRKEDDVNLMDMDRFTDYLRKIYDVKNCSAPINSGNKYIILPVLSYKHAYRSLLLYPEKKRAQVRRSNYEKWPEGIRDYLDDNYDVEMSLDEKKDWMYFIFPKNGKEANNRFFISLIDDILAHVDEPLLERKVNESIWSDMQDRGTRDLVKKEDDVNMMDVNKFFEYLIAKYWRPEQKVNSLDKDHYSKDFDIDIVVDPKHGTTIFGSYNDGELRRLMVVSNELFIHIGAKSPKNLVWTPSKPGESLNKRYYITEKNREISNKTFIDVIEFFLHNEVNESIWSDMQDRGTGDIEKKEDDINLLDYDEFYDYLLSRYEFSDKNLGIEKITGYNLINCSLLEDKDESRVYRTNIFDWKKNPYITVPDIKSFTKRPLFNKLSDNFKLENIPDAYSPKFKVLPKDGGDVDNKFFIKVIDFIIDNAESPLVPTLKRRVNESVWSDMQERGTGEVRKKEDEVLTDMEINSLNEFILMYCRRERGRYIQNHIVPPPPSRRKENDYEGLIKYIEDRRDENLFTNVGDYEKIIRYIKKNWDRLDMDTYIKKYICSPSVMKGKKIVECDGVPGGATPANVGGMGSAYFPGPNGEPGSGDIPMPTGKVYQQVAPFGIFIRAKKGKKKKKKFRKEDEPCVHSPNAKVYDYVDDYREYVDRTYNNMDRK